MKVIDPNGNVLIEKENHPVATRRASSLRVSRHTKGIRKTVAPVVMSKEDFCFTNPDDRSFFSFRIPAKERITLK